MKFIQIILLIFSTPVFSFGQFETLLAENLQKRETISFNRLTDSLLKLRSSDNSLFFGNWEVQREIVPEFQERIFTFQILNQSPDKNIFIRVDVLSTNSDMVFYELKTSRKYSTAFNADSTICSYKNDSLLNSFEKIFNSQFRNKLNFSDLFIDSITYSPKWAKNCKTISERDKVANLVKKKDIISLTKLLKSGNVETQLYAVEGFYDLKLRHYQLSSEQKQIIKNILKRQGTYRYCAEMIYYPNYITNFLPTVVF